MSTQAIPPYYGTTATGENRFARPELEAELDSLMSAGNGTRIFGLRRIGKSSEARAYKERMKRTNPSLIVLELNAEGCTSEAKLLLDILNAMPNKGWRERITASISSNNSIAQVARDAIQKMTGAQADIQAYFAPIMHAIEQVLQPDESIVIIIDEIAWLCRSILDGDPKEGRSRVDVLLATLRRWRNKGVRMLLLGSIGITAFGRQHRLDLSHLNDLSNMEIPPLTRDEAQLLVQCLARGAEVKNWSDAHTQALLDESVALYPAIIQQAFLQLQRGQRAVALEHISDLFANKIRPNLDGAFYTQFDRRLQQYRALPAPMPTLLQTLLQQIMTHPAQNLPYPDLRQSATDEADLGDALAILREDGFLRLRAPRNAPQQWFAASSLVSAWWAQRRGGSKP